MPKIYSVSEFNHTLQGVLASQFSVIWLQGEISGLVKPASGHLYFSLKDRGAQIRCVMFKNRNRYINFKPANGDEILVRAQVAVYEARGDLQLIIEHAEPVGLGTLLLQYEELKRKLAVEGLFDQQLKKDIPALPGSIAIISSASGAVIHDVITVLKRRAPSIELIIYPASVQGDKASAEIIAQIKKANSDSICDFILLIRGGGSVEDQWCFNNEELIRQIHASELPVVSAIGHETDQTLCDFVSDLSAPTPSAAAEMISNEFVRIKTDFLNFDKRLYQSIQAHLNTSKQVLSLRSAQLHSYHPARVLQAQMQKLDMINHRLDQNLSAIFATFSTRLTSLLHRLEKKTPAISLNKNKIVVETLKQRLDAGIKNQLNKRLKKFDAASEKLQVLNPTNTLKRGYCIVSSSDNKLISSAKSLNKNNIINTIFADGEASSKVLSVEIKK